jgi:hypothetical protein
VTRGICRICGSEGEGELFDGWVRDTFTNWPDLMPGEIICDGCAFWFDQRAAELQRRMGKDKPQRMQNYSHFVVGGQWEPVSKGDKPRMAALLLGETFPEMAAIAVSGQKHIAFRARRNPPGQGAGWVQFEEQAVWVERDKLRDLLAAAEKLYAVFSKGEIETGRYFPARILQFGMAAWYALEEQIKPIRATTIFQLALFLAQRSEEDNGDEQGDGGDAAQDHLAGDTRRLQKPLPHDDPGAVRERNPGGGVHVQPGKVYQLDLFAAASGPGEDGGGAGGGE